jgi:hypothetical protein
MSNKFSGSTPLTKPPPYCKTLTIPLPDVPAATPPPSLEGYARWTDLDPLGPLDIAMQVTMPQVASAWKWTGEKTVQGTRFILTLENVGGTYPWLATLDVWRTPIAHESMSFPQFNMPLDFPWDTHLLTWVHLPGYDYRQAQVAQ